MSTNPCPTCGAVVYKHASLRLEDFPGNEHVKRALEVALTGHHSLGITGWQAEEFARWGAAQHLAVYPARPCPCGNYGSVRWECTCTSRQVRRFRRDKAYQQALGADLWITASAPNQYKLNDLRRESEQAVLARVAAAQAMIRPSEVLCDESLLGLQRAWLAQIGRPERMPAILRVAATITQLAGVWAGRAPEQIGPAHLAEAMQYTPRDQDY